MFEGIFVASSISTLEIIIKMVEEIIVSGPDTERTFTTKKFYTEDYVHLNIENVAWIECIDTNTELFCRNLCREGLKQIPRVKVTKTVVPIELCFGAEEKS
jgi:hypothetical protein